MELAHYDWNELRARMHSSKEEEVIRDLQYLFSGKTDQVKFNLNQNNAKVVSEWASKYGYSSEIVKTYQNGTVDIVISRKKSQLTELDQLISSLSSSISVKESVRSELSGLLAGRKASIVLNLNQSNAEKVKDFAENAGLKVEILRSYNNGTVDILVSKKDRSEGSVLSIPWFGSTQDNGKINSNNKKYSYYMNAEIVGFRILQDILRTNQKFKDFFEQLDDFEKRLFIGYAIGSAFRNRPGFGSNDYELRTSRSQGHFTSYVKTNLNSLMENFERRLKQAVSKADEFINLLDQKFKQQNITLKGQLGPEYEKFRRGLIVMFMEFEIKDITPLANIDINRFLSWSNQLNEYRGGRHSPKNSVDPYEIKHSVLSSLILGKMFGVDPRFYLVIAAQESNFDNSIVGKSGTGLGQQTANGSILTNYTINYKSNYGNYISPVTTRAMMFEIDSGSNGSIFISFYEMAKLIQEKKGYLDISKYDRSNQSTISAIRKVAERYNGNPNNQIEYGTSVVNSQLWGILK
jgi:acylphosphatase